MVRYAHHSSVLRTAPERRIQRVAAAQAAAPGHRPGHRQVL